MSEGYSGSWWWGLSVSASLVTCLTLSGGTGAQTARDTDPGLLDEAKRIDQIAAQKLESEMREALREAQRWAQSEPARAVERLRKALTQLEDDTALTTQRRESLRRMLKDRIRVIEADAESSAAKTAADQRDKDAKANRRRAADEQRQDDQAQIRDRLSTIKELRDEGKIDLARRQAAELGRQHPRNTPAQAADNSALTADQIQRERRLRRQREESWVGAQQEVVRSNTLTGDIEYPKDWQERTKGRTTTTPLTGKEKSILQSLNTTISVSFKNSKLDNVIEYLQTYVGQPILIDREALKDAEISYDTPITINIKGASLRTVLRRTLADMGLTYAIKEEAIQITSAQRAKELMVVRRYYVGDLLANMGALGGVSTPSLLGRTIQGSFINPWNGVPTGFWQLGGVQVGQTPNPQALSAQNAQDLKQIADQLIELIQTSVDTQSWREHGGNGTITFHAPSLSLLIKQSAEVHALLGNSSLGK